MADKEDAVSAAKDEEDPISAVKNEEDVITKILAALKSVAPSLIYDRTKASRKRRVRTTTIKEFVCDCCLLLLFTFYVHIY